MWTSRDKCKKCHRYVSYWAVLRNENTCPYCGSQSYIALDAVESEVGRWVKTGEWWEFWKRPRWQTKKEYEAEGITIDEAIEKLEKHLPKELGHLNLKVVAKEIRNGKTSNTSTNCDYM